MAALLQTVKFAAPAEAATQTVTFAAATAGSKLVLWCTSGAVHTIADASWTKRTASLSALEICVFDKTAVGGETSVAVTLSGPRVMAATLQEFTGLGAFVPGVTSVGNSTAPATSALTVSGQSLCITAMATKQAALFQGWSSGFFEVANFATPASAHESPRLGVALLDSPAATNSTGSYIATINNWQTVQVAYADSSAVATYTWPNVIVQENALLGNPTSQWQVTGMGDPEIQGFPSDSSINRGTTLSFKVDSGNLAFTVKIFRLGYYSGLGARQVASFSGTPAVQPTPVADVTTGTSAAAWSVTASWAAPASAVSGVYLALLTRSDNKVSNIPFVVRNDADTNKVVLKTCDTTWHAYNYFGPSATRLDGKSLYGASENANPSLRSKAVSYDRPYATRHGVGHTYLFDAEYPFLRFVERNGYDLTYLSSVDTDRTPGRLLGQKLIISSGHDEYWSKGMRDAHVAARDAGVNLAFFSGNHAFWRVRFDVTYRMMTCYKDTLDGHSTDPGGYTGTWRDTRAFNTLRQPEHALTGSFFIANGIRVDSMVVTDKFKASPIWRNTAVAALAPGQSISYPELLGFEWQEVRNDADMPSPFTVLSSTPIDITGYRSNDDGSAYTGAGSATHALVLHKLPSKGLVFSTGTVRWAWGLDSTHDGGTTAANSDIQQATLNILADLGALPASTMPGRTTPATVPVSQYNLSAHPVWSTSFENGVSGAAVVGADFSPTGGADGGAVYSNAFAKTGTKSVKFQLDLNTTPGTTASRIYTSFGPYTGDVYGRAYFMLPSTPVGGNAQILSVTDSTFQGNVSLEVQPNGKLTGGPSVTTPTFVSTKAITPGRWFRVEWHVNTSTAVGELRLYLSSPDSAAADETYTFTPSGTDTNYVYIKATAQWQMQTVTVYTDSPAVDTLGWLGPDTAPTTAVQTTLNSTWNLATTSFKQLGFESGVNGGALAANDPQGWTTVLGDSKYSSTYRKAGGLSYKATANGSVDNAAIDVPYGATYTTQDVFGRLYGLMPSFAQGNKVAFLTVRSSSSNANIWFGVNTNGTISVGPGDSPSMFTSTVKIAPGDWFRVEWRVRADNTAAGSSFEARLFVRRPDSSSPDEVFTLTNHLLAENHDNLRIGAMNGTGGTLNPVWLDQVSLSTQGWIGPDGIATTPVTAQRTENWNVTRSASKTFTMLWNESLRQSTTTGFLWATLAGVSATCASTWQTRQAVTRAPTVAWNQRAQTAAVKTSSWDVRALVTNSRTATWSTRSRVPVASTLTWTVRTPVTRSTAPAWNVRTGVSLSKAFDWPVLLRGTKTQSALWSLRDQVTVVNASVWQTRTRVSLHPDSVWAVRQKVPVAKTSTWVVIKRTSIVLTPSWSVYVRAIPVTFSAVWRIRTPVSRQQSSQWRVRKTEKRFTGTSWNITARTTSTHVTFRWNMKGSVFPDMPLMVPVKRGQMRDASRRYERSHVQP